MINSISNNVNSNVINSISNNFNEQSNKSSESGFEKLLRKSIDSLNDEQLVSIKNKEDISTGQVEDLQKAIIQIDRADLSLTLGLEVKNKVLSAYKEIMNTQI